MCNLSEANRVRIAASIDLLAKTPHLGVALKGRLTGLRRLRVGSYRIMYEVQQNELVILVV
ncbi:MAG: type II toxin-antitoxin system RelE/ParE family toxin [Gammaproteobacteria bacterium]|nr:type II toxin-antitoxin system RelE/ParE family toxin [Gammaproteobacteria bacterium]